MKIRFVTDWCMFKSGQEAELSTDCAEKLIAISVAVPVETKAVDEPKKHKMVTTPKRKKGKKKPDNTSQPGREKE